MLGWLQIGNTGDWRLPGRRPDFAEAHYNIGLICLRQGRENEAITHLGKAVNFKPDFAPAQANLGRILASHGKFDEAIRHLTESVRINPGYEQLLQLVLKERKSRSDTP